MAAVVLALLVSACSGPSKSVMEEGAVGGVQREGVTATGVDQGGGGSGGPLGGSAGEAALGGPGATQENRIVYFDYDRFDIRPEHNAAIQAHGRYLSANPGARIRLEGHADERGTREYNIGLGERRAQAVRNVLLLQGAGADQIATVSYGEERPAVLGSDEEAWSLNRRVEIVYGQ